MEQIVQGRRQSKRRLSLADTAVRVSQFGSRARFRLRTTLQRPVLHRSPVLSRPIERAAHSLNAGHHSAREDGEAENKECKRRDG